MGSQDSTDDRTRGPAPDADTIIERPAGSEDGSEGDALEVSADGSLHPGTRLGRYVVLEEIGAGGMGLVFAAYDPELNRKVALKLMKPTQRERARKRGRLLKEAQALAKLAHPNVITVYDVGTLDERVFVAMELVEGDTLKGWLQSAKRRWDEVLSVFVPAGRGLSAAHAAGLIHRDFKPDNVLIGGDGRVRVMDFGLARPAPGSESVSLDPERSIDDDTDDEPLPDAPPDPGDVAAPMMTQTGSIMGTPAFMAPEQHLGRVTDPRSDQFSFCVALYQGLYGELPFEGRDAGTLTRRKLEGAVREAPSGISVPGWVRRAMLRGLESEPAARWPSMDELLDELENDPRIARRKMLSAGAGVLAMVGLVAGVQYYRNQRPEVCQGFEGTLASVWNAERKQATRDGLLPAATPGTDGAWLGTASDKIGESLDGYGQAWVEMSIEACEATHVRGEQSTRLLGLRQACLDQRLAEVDAYADILTHADATVLADALPGVYALSPLSRCADSEALASAVDPPQTPEATEAVAGLRRTLARVKMLAASGRRDDAITMAQDAYATAGTLAYPPIEAEARFRLGQVQGPADARAAEENLQESAWAAASVKHDTVAAAAANELVAVVGIELGKHEEGLGWSRHAEAAVKRIGLGGHDEATLRHNIGAIHLARGNYDEAATAYEQALALYDKLPRTELAVAAALRDLGDVRIGEGRFDDAEALLSRAQGITEEAAGEAHPLVAKAIAGRGRVADARNDHAGARKLYAEAIALASKALGDGHVDLAPLYADVGRSHAETEDFDAAIEAFVRAHQLLHDALGQHPAVARARFDVGQTRLRSGDRGGAREDYEAALHTWEQTRGKDHPDLAFALTHLALLDLDEDQPKPAIERLERALKVRGRKSLAPMLLADTQFALARALHMSGEDEARARELAAKARESYAAAGTKGKPAVARVDQWLGELQTDTNEDEAG
jgi:tetratricopeptide (TPR) repeat protein/predicted Ser/Thr protein kinase